jgi:hypothetical protein
MAHFSHNSQSTPSAHLSSPKTYQQTVRIHADRVRRPVDAPTTRTCCGAEELIVDDRADITPAQMVEDKLARILKDSALPVSHLQMRGLLRTR